MNSCQLLSLHIPFVEEKHKDKDYVSEIFSNQNLGTVYQIDFIKNDVGTQQYYSMNVYLIWSETTASKNLQNKIIISKDIAYLVHDEPNYWILTKNTNYNKTNGFNNKRICYLYDENLMLKKEIEDLKRKMNHLLKRDLLISRDFESSEFASSEITSDFSECDEDSYFSKLWDIEEDIAKNEAQTRGLDYELQEFTYK
jgi:hypothetical protein